MMMPASTHRATPENSLVAVTGPEFLETNAEIKLLEMLLDEAEIRNSLCSRAGRRFIYEPDWSALFTRHETTILAAIEKKDSLFVDFNGLRATADFVESFLQALFFSSDSVSSWSAWKRIVFTNPDRGTLISLHRALVEYKVNGFVIPGAEDETIDLLYIGKLERHLVSVVDFIQARGAIIASDLIRENIVHTNGDANGRLKELYTMGLIEREATTGATGRPAFQYRCYDPFRYAQSSSRGVKTAYKFYSVSGATSSSARPRERRASHVTGKERAEEPEPDRAVSELLSPLDATHRQMLYTLSLYPGGCDQDTLLRLLSLTAPRNLRIEPLVRQKLVSRRYDEGRARLRLLETVQGQVADFYRRRHPQQWNQGRRQQAALLLTLSMTVKGSWGADPVRWRRILDRELPNIRAVIDWLTAEPRTAGDIESALQSLNNLRRFWEVAWTGSDLFARLLSSADELPTGAANPAVLGEARTVKSVLESHTGNLNEAVIDARKPPTGFKEG